MRRIRVLLIEGIILIVYLIVFGLSFHLVDRPDGFMLDAIILFSSMVVLGNAIEEIIDLTIVRRLRKGRIILMIIRNLSCFILIIGAFYLVFYLKFLFEINSAASIMFLLLSACGAFVHLIISHIICKTVNLKPDSSPDGESGERNKECWEHEDESYE